MAARQKRVKRKGNLEKRFESMTPGELEQRWRDMRPRYFRWLGLFVLLAAIVYLINHVFLMQHTAAELKADSFYTTTISILNVAFQISCIFCFLFTVLTGMSYIYGRASTKTA